MIKFIHKKNIKEKGEKGKVIIYYNVSDIFLGTALLLLVIFFIHDYLSHRINYLNNENPGTYSNMFSPGQPKVNPQIITP